MARTSIWATAPALVPLEWESTHFGIRAAQLEDPNRDDAALAAALRHARTLGMQLVVWPASSERHVSETLCGALGGLLADRKATFVRPLADSDDFDRTTTITHEAIMPFTATAASSDLLELAVAAGEHSRFRVDRHFSPERFEAMYHLWIERSVNGQLADAVFVAPLRGNDGLGDRLAGMITLAESKGTADICLLAVSPAARRRGVATGLLCAAHRWMRTRGAHSARVVTQLANAPACKFYERAGYELTRVENIYHFWL